MSNYKYATLKLVWEYNTAFNKITCHWKNKDKTGKDKAIFQMKESATVYDSFSPSPLMTFIGKLTMWPVMKD